MPAASTMATRLLRLTLAHLATHRGPVQSSYRGDLSKPVHIEWTDCKSRPLVTTVRRPTRRTQEETDRNGQTGS